MFVAKGQKEEEDNKKKKVISSFNQGIDLTTARVFSAVDTEIQCNNENNFEHQVLTTTKVLPKII